MTKEKTCAERVAEHLEDRLDDLRKLWKAYQGGEEDVEDLGNIFEYGLCFDYVPNDDEGQGFFRYQLSTGGPGDEFRFFADAELDCYRVEYWFLDWFDGAHKHLSGDDNKLLMEIWEWFKEGGTVEAEFKKATE